jgi:glycosyltransferase involved in cell wall biosynthesis
MGITFGPSVLLLVSTDLTYDQRMAKIADALGSAGFEVTLIGRRLRTSVALRQDALQYQQRRINCIFEKGILFYLEFQLRLLFLVLTTKADIVSAADIDTLPGAMMGHWLVSLFRRQRIVLDAHEIFSEQEEVVSRPMVHRLWHLAERFFIPHVDAAYTVSSGVARWYQALTKVPFGVVRNLPERSGLQPISNYHADQELAMRPLRFVPYLLYVGAVNRNRGLEHVITSMPDHKFNLVICGDGPDLQDLKRLSNQLQVSNRVFFEGFVAPDRLPEYYQNAYLGLLVLDGQGLNYQYSLANKFFDYMMHGLPQLLSPLPEYLEILSTYPFAYLCTPEPKAISEAIRHLKAEPEVYNRLKDACAAAKDQYNWQREQDKLVQIYRDLSL